MSEKSISLQDMGLSSVKTPAEIAEKEYIEQNGNKIEVVKPKSKIQSIEEDKTESTIHTPSTKDGTTNYGRVITDINSIAKNPIKQEMDPIDKTKKFFKDLSQKGIDRTKEELSAPGGLIDRAKKEYIKTKYTQLINRAKTNESLAKKIRQINDKMLSDSRFDEISEYERQGYIVFVIARDKNTGVDDEYINSRLRSIEQQKLANDILSKDDPNYKKMEIDTDTENKLKQIKYNKNNLVDIDDVVSDSEDNKPADRYTDPITGKPRNEVAATDDKVERVSFSEDFDLESIYDEEPEPKQEKPDKEPIPTEKEESEEEIDDTDEEDIEYDDDTDEEDEEKDEDEFNLEEIRKTYNKELSDAFSFYDKDEIEGFNVSKKIMKFSSKLLSASKNAKKSSITWALQYTGIPIELTAMSGDELLTFSPESTNLTTYAGLNKMFYTIYNHVVNKNKPSYDVWIRKTSYYDIDNLLFAVYLANFKNTNFITYSCNNHKCGNIFLKKVNIDDMISYPNDKVKERIEKILAKDPIEKSMYMTKPIQISEKYAMSYCSPSIYSMMLEPMTLNKDNAEKYKYITAVSPSLAKVYYIDKQNKTLVPISFGTVEGDTEKTVLRKIKGLAAIFNELDADQRTKAMVKSLRMMGPKDGEEQIKYHIPSQTCPKCGNKIPVDTNSTVLQMLFTRAQLATVAAYLKE